MTPDEIQKDREAVTPGPHEPDYKTSMLYHSDRADAYMGERDALTAENAALKKWADELKWALIEAQAALNGAPNTVGLHDQIEMALEKRHD